MILYALWFYWVVARGYRWRPWASPLLRWRIETYSGIPAEQVTFGVFWKFLRTERHSLSHFLKWGVRMRRLEQHRREGTQSEPRA
ncbi:MAG: hypothetical protein HYX73_04420 [Acidobacteria bacterium]|nr:hypothetical protein [Acidobacteriota bacterium]